MFKIAVVFFISLAFVEAKASTLRGHDRNAPQDGHSPQGYKDEVFGIELTSDAEDFETQLDVDLAVDAEDFEAKEEFLRYLKITENNMLSATPERTLRGLLVGNSCPNNTNEPTCYYNLRAKPGTWLCQMTYDEVTGEEQFRSICVNSNKELPDINHSCGCCGGQCPPPCTCGCGFGQPDGSFLGRYIVNKNGYETCVRKELAIWVANGDSPWSCTEDCDEH